MARWGKCDFEQLQELSDRLEQLADVDFDAFCRDAARELAARLLTKVIKRTPVGVRPKIEGPLTQKVQGEDYIAQTVNAKGEKVFRRRKGKRYTVNTKQGEIHQKYWAGYTGGTLRNGWISKTEEEARSRAGKTPGAEQIAAYVQELIITKNGENYQIEIINPVEYASYVEYGHRQEPGRYVAALGKRLKKNWVKGRFMLTISTQELQQQAPKILEQKMYQFLKGCFDAG